MGTKRIAIIVAGGSGKRMGMEVPKQFLLLDGKPILMHTLFNFYNFDKSIEIVLVLPENEIERWKEYCDKFSFLLPHQIVKGGKTRFHSVLNGLQYIDTPSIVAVHDGVRPFTSEKVLRSCFENVLKFGAVIPVIAPVDSIRKIVSDSSVAVDRNNYRLVQTPQVFDGELLLRAYSQEYNEKFTDDASVVEQLLGKSVTMVEGNIENMKITTPYDLIVAEALIKKLK